MKKIILLSAVIIATLVSCSTEDSPTYDLNSVSKTKNLETYSDFSTLQRDSIGKSTDSISEIDPTRPRKP